MGSSTGLTTGLTTTRKQLRGYGATPYLARKLTESLSPVEKQGNAYVYQLEPTIGAIRIYSERSRVQAETKQTLETILSELLARLSNVVSLPPTDSASDVGYLAQSLIKAIRRTDRSMAEMKAVVASMGNQSS
ncbi:MAG: hypothetical protein AAFN12_19410 [Cyanobacteria bacterium J06560_2]